MSKRNKIGKRLRERVFIRDGNRCKFCKSEDNLTIDHIIPKSRGGKNRIENLQVLCQPCNIKKGCKMSYKPNELQITLSDIRNRIEAINKFINN